MVESEHQCIRHAKAANRSEPATGLERTSVSLPKSSLSKCGRSSANPSHRGTEARDKKPLRDHPSSWCEIDQLSSNLHHHFLPLRWQSML